MDKKTLFYIDIGTFLFCWIGILTLPNLLNASFFSGLLRLCENSCCNFILLMLLFTGVAWTVSLSSDFLYRQIRRLKPFRPKLGEVLVSRGYISRRQLKVALEIQRMRIGEILLAMGVITESQLAEALKIQKKDKTRRLGEIIKTLGYATGEEIECAAGSVGRKLGKILLDLELVGQNELRNELGRMWYGTTKGLWR